MRHSRSKDRASRALLLACILLLPACAQSSKAAPSSSSGLLIEVNDTRGGVHEASIDCEERTLSGFLVGKDVETLCGVLRENEAVLQPPDPGRICTQQYGGPESAALRGQYQGESVERDLGRSNGCEISEWEALEELLTPAKGNPSSTPPEPEIQPEGVGIPGTSAQL